MKTTIQIPLRIGNPPADLREWVDEQLLVKLALDAVQTLDWPAAATDRNELRPQMMLTLLSYCYAAGIYGSGDIAATLRSDRVLHYICARAYPDGRELRHFGVKTASACSTAWLTFSNRPGNSDSKKRASTPLAAPGSKRNS